MLDGSYFFECQCDCDEHTLRFILEADPEYPEIYCCVFLNHYQRWYQRIWPAIKHIIGLKSKYGHFDVWSMKGEDIDKLILMVKEWERLIKVHQWEDKIRKMQGENK